MTDATTSQEPLRAMIDGIPVSLSLCGVADCHRPAEWAMTAMDADGAVLLAVLSCNSPLHIGFATAAARRVCDGPVEIRKVEQ